MFEDKIQTKENLPYRWLAHWKWATMAAKIRAVQVTRGDVDVAQDGGLDKIAMTPLWAAVTAKSTENVDWNRATSIGSLTQCRRH